MLYMHAIYNNLLINAYMIIIQKGNILYKYDSKSRNKDKITQSISW